MNTIHDNLRVSDITTTPRSERDGKNFDEEEFNYIGDMYNLRYSFFKTSFKLIEIVLHKCLAIKGNCYANLWLSQPVLQLRWPLLLHWRQKTVIQIIWNSTRVAFIFSTWFCKLFYFSQNLCKWLFFRLRVEILILICILWIF